MLDAIAEIKNISRQEAETATWQNAMKMYGIPIPDTGENGEPKQQPLPDGYREPSPEKEKTWKN